MVGEQRLERGVLRLETDPAVALAMEGLHRRLVGRLVVADERLTDLSGTGVRLLAYDDDVPVEDPPRSSSRP